METCNCGLAADIKKYFLLPRILIGDAYIVAFELGRSADPVNLCEKLEGAESVIRTVNGRLHVKIKTGDFRAIDRIGREVFQLFGKTEAFYKMIESSRILIAGKAMRMTGAVRFLISHDRNELVKIRQGVGSPSLSPLQIRGALSAKL